MTALDSARTVSELEELRELTADESGAQRVAWTPVWAQARVWMREKLEQLPVEIEVDQGGNQWATLEGESERAVLIGGHIDSVPNGGWLDGSLNLLAGLECLRRIAAEGKPPVTVRLVDWADEEGCFGHSLLGSSAVSGHLDPNLVRRLRGKDGVLLAQEFGAVLSPSPPRLWVSYRYCSRIRRAMSISNVPASTARAFRCATVTTLSGRVHSGLLDLDPLDR